MLLIYKLLPLLLFVVVIICVLKFFTGNNCQVREKEKWKDKRKTYSISSHSLFHLSLSTMDAWHTTCPPLKFLARDSLKVPPKNLWPETRNPSSTCYCGKIWVQRLEIVLVRRFVGWKDNCVMNMQMEEWGLTLVQGAFS